MDHTGLSQLTGAGAFLVYTAQVPSCSVGVLSKVGPVFHALPRSKLSASVSQVLHKGTNLGMCFVPFPVLRSSSDQMLGKGTVPCGLCVLISSLVPVVVSWV